MNKKILSLVILSLIMIFVGCSESRESKNTNQVLENTEQTTELIQKTEEKTLYTCGMHPHVVQDHPGTCPICHMDLTPMKKKPKGDNKQANNKKKERKIKHWVAPMDPTYISDKPGKSPMGMDLVPVYEGDELHEGPEVIVDPVVVQNMGIRVAKVEKGPVVRKIRTLGEVEVAEDQESVVNLRFSGWIEKIWADETEKEVKRGDRLFQIYSPELISAQEEYLLAVQGDGANSELAMSAKKRLQLFQIPEFHIKHLLKTKNSQLRLVVRAPRSGFILQKNVVMGAKVSSGIDLYRIGNITNIWIKAEVYEYDAPWIKVNQAATMTLPFVAGKSWDGKVSFVHSTLNRESRTLPVRLEFKNPGLNLKPGMSATVYISVENHNDVIRIPTESILHSGRREIVFVTSGDGKFMPKEVVTGLSGDNRYTEIVQGVSPGETVVTSGQFLLDSESQLQEAIQKLLADRLAANEKKSESPNE